MSFTEDFSRKQREATERQRQQRLAERQEKELSGQWHLRKRKHPNLGVPWTAERRAKMAATESTREGHLTVAVIVAAYQKTVPPRTRDRVATTLGIHRRTLWRQLKLHGLTFGALPALAGLEP